MPRPQTEPSLTWKIQIPATIAGRIEFMLGDPLTARPKYGARTELVVRLLEFWEAQQQGITLPLPSLEDLRAR